MRRMPKRWPRKILASIVVKLAIGSETVSPIWNPERGWHVMLHCLTYRDHTICSTHL